MFEAQEDMWDAIYENEVLPTPAQAAVAEAQDMVQACTENLDKAEKWLERKIEELEDEEAGG